MQRGPGAPPHRLCEVVGAFYELMRNFGPKDRLMNHTLVVVRAVHAHHVVIETLTGQQFPLPRICFRWVLSKGVAYMIRRRYPLRPAYAATCSGSQGSTLYRVVVDVRSSPFAHGHLYVALSRVNNSSAIRVLTTLERQTAERHALTKNVVWPELLLPALEKPGTVGAPLRKRPASCLS